MYSAIANVGSNGHAPTVTATLGGAAYLTIVVVAFSGAANNTPQDTSKGSTAGDTSADVHHGDVVAAAAGVMVGFMACARADMGTITEDANWTLIDENEENYKNHSSCYRLVAAGTYNDGWTQQTQKRWGAIGAAYSEAAAGGIPRRNPFSRPFAGPLGGCL